MQTCSSTFISSYYYYYNCNCNFNSTATQFWWLMDADDDDDASELFHLIYITSIISNKEEERYDRVSIYKDNHEWWRWIKYMPSIQVLYFAAFESSSLHLREVYCC